MSDTPSKGPKPRRKAASTSKLNSGKTNTYPRGSQSAAMASRIFEISGGPENPSEPEVPAPEGPVPPTARILFQPEVPGAPESTATGSVEARAERSNNPSKRCKEPTEEDNSEPAVNRNLSMVLRRFSQDDKAKERHTYIFETVVDEGSKTVYKIGMSYSPSQRRSMIKKKCKFAKIKEVTAAITGNPSKFAAMAEKIIHKELLSFKHTVKCFCGTRHGEYFDVSEAVALKARERWVNFCKQEPWGPDGKLLPFWEERLDKKLDIAKDCGYDGLAASWDAFTKASKLDREKWNREIWFRFFKSQLMPAIALVEAAIIASQSPSSHHALWFIGLGTFVVWACSREWTRHDALFIQVPEEQQAAPAKPVVGKKVTEGLDGKTADDPQAKITNVTADEEEGRGAVPVANYNSREEVAELKNTEEKSRGPTNPWDSASEDNEWYNDSGQTLVTDEVAEDSAMTGINDSEEDEEELGGEDGDEDGEMDCDEMDFTIMDDDGISDLMQGLGLRGSSDLKTAIPGPAAGSPYASGSKPVLVRA